MIETGTSTSSAVSKVLSAPSLRSSKLLAKDRSGVEPPRHVTVMEATWFGLPVTGVHRQVAKDGSGELSSHPAERVHAACPERAGNVPRDGIHAVGRPEKLRRDLIAGPGRVLGPDRGAATPAACGVDMLVPSNTS